MLIASALNRMTTKITINTAVVIQTHAAELFLNNGDITPETLRIRLSPVFTRLRQIKGQEAPRAAADDPIVLLRRLGELRDAGIVTQEEFEAKKTELLRRL